MLAFAVLSPSLPFCRLDASSGRRSGQRGRKRPAGIAGTGWHFHLLTSLPGSSLAHSLLRELHSYAVLGVAAGQGRAGQGRAGLYPVAAQRETVVTVHTLNTAATSPMMLKSCVPGPSAASITVPMRPTIMVSVHDRMGSTRQLPHIRPLAASAPDSTCA
jgi:hypothetical protein